MKLTPMDIRQYEFRRSLTGYETGQVRAFLDVVADEMEALVRENSKLKTEFRRKESQLKEVEESEKGVREALMALHKLTQQVRGDAEKEAQIVIHRAQLQAEAVMVDAQKRYNQLLHELQELRRTKIQFATSVRSAVEQHLKLLDEGKDDESARMEDKIRFFPPSTGGQSE